MSDGVTRLGIEYRLDAGQDVADLACLELFLWFLFNSEKTYFFDPVRSAGRHEGYMITRADGAVDYSAGNDGATVRIIIGIKDKYLKWRRGIPFRWREMIDDGLKDLFNTLAPLGRTELNHVTVQSQVLFNLEAHRFRLS